MSITLQLSFDATHPVAISGGQSDTWLGYYNIATGHFDKAALGDSGATPVFVLGAYDPNTDYHLGYYGLDTVNHTAWAVVDYDGTFAVVPEPGTDVIALFMSGVAVFGGAVRCRAVRA